MRGRIQNIPPLANPPAQRAARGKSPAVKKCLSPFARLADNSRFGLQKCCAASVVFAQRRTILGSDATAARPHVTPSLPTGTARAVRGAAQRLDKTRAHNSWVSPAPELTVVDTS